MFDIVLFIVLAVLSPFIDLLFFPRLRRGGKRMAYYLFGIALQWLFTGAVFVLWMVNGRPWSALRLGGSALAGWIIVALYALMVLLQRQAILAKPERLQRLVHRDPGAEALMPHTSGERNAFFVVALTAGFTEELIYRGFVMWCLTAWLGLAAGVVISSLFFGVAHAYLGKAHVIRTSIVGLIFALIVLASGSLWPAVIVHALTDLLAGDLGYRALNAEAPRFEASPEPART